MTGTLDKAYVKTRNEDKIAPARSDNLGGWFFSKHRWMIDWCITLGYVLIMLPGLVHSALTGAVDQWQAVCALVTTFLIGACLLSRRRYSLGVLIAVLILALAKTVATGLLDAIAIPLALYAATVYLSARLAWFAFAGVVVATSVVLGLAGVANGLTQATMSSLIVSLSVQIVAGLLGFLVGFRRRYLVAVREHLEQDAKDKKLTEELERASERAALSREMHDIVGHTLTAIINLSDGADASFDSHPGLAREGLRKINEVARTALGETRTVVSALRNSSHEASRSPQPRTEQIPALLETARAAGLSATLTVNGEPFRGHNVQSHLYRIVQEAVTNTMRHARNASRIDVVFDYSRDRVTVQIHDDGRCEIQDEHRDGQGLTGISERAALSGGSSSSGPAPGGGWYVTAELHRDDER